MADTIKLRRMLNQACLDGTPCYEIECFIGAACVPGFGNKINWWTPIGKIPCFISSHNKAGEPIHPQDPMR